MVAVQGDRTEPKPLECLVEGADEAHSSPPGHEHDPIPRGEVLDRMGAETRPSQSGRQVA